MRELGIPMSDWSMRGILGLNGRVKTMIRRPMKQALWLHEISGTVEWAGAVHPAREFGYIAWFPGENGDLAELTKQEYAHGFEPRYRVGDLLYCKEAWAPSFHGLDCIHKADPVLKPWGYTGPWKPARFMPKAFARVWLRVTEVRAERLWDISYDDVLAEGVTEAEIVAKMPAFPRAGADIEALRRVAARLAYKAVWDGIYGPKSPYRWELSPWVWAYTFERIERGRA